MFRLLSALLRFEVATFTVEDLEDMTFKDAQHGPTRDSQFWGSRSRAVRARYFLKNLSFTSVIVMTFNFVSNL